MVNDKNSFIRGQVALALVVKGIALGGLNRSEEAIAIYNEVVRRFGDDKEPFIMKQVAGALNNKA